MARKREPRDGMEENPRTWDGLVKEAAELAALNGVWRSRKRFVGVRQRPSGRWVAEIKDTVQNIRVWLGTFDTVEQAARACDEAARLLRGTNTRTNFCPGADSEASSRPALPPKITKLILQRLREKNHASDPDPTLPDCIERKQEQVVDSSDTQFSGFLNDHNDFTEGNSIIYDADRPTVTSESCLTKKDDSVDNSSSTEQSSRERSNRGEGAEFREEENLNFHFLDHVRSPFLPSPFEIGEEIVEPIGPECDADEPFILRMRYERKFSASLYAFNGIPECLKQKLGSRNAQAEEISEQLQDPDSAESRETIEAKPADEFSKSKGIQEQASPEISTNSATSTYSVSSATNGELSLWSSLSSTYSLHYINLEYLNEKRSSSGQSTGE